MDTQQNVATWRAKIVNRLPWGLLVCLITISTAALGARLMAPAEIAFPDFPMGAVSIDLGQTLTIKVDALNDDGKGVIWSCVGDACAKLTSTSKWATFYATGLTGTATITATSIAHPSVHRSLTVTVNLNAIPDMLCDQPLLIRQSNIFS